MSIFIKEVLENKFEVTIKKTSVTKHTILLSDEFYEFLSNKKISKIELLKYSIKFLLKKESNTLILPIFKLEIISEYFPEYESEIRKLIK